MSRLIVSAFFVTLLAGCAENPWYQAKKTPSELGQDQQACEKQAALKYPMDPGNRPDLPIKLPPIDISNPPVALGVTPPTMSYDEGRIEDQRFVAFNACMESKGYRH